MRFPLAIWFGFLLLCCCAVASATDNATAPNSRAEIAGPTYSRSEIRRLEIEGLHLGMSASRAAAAMAALGFVFENPSGVEGGGFYRSPDRRTTVWLQFTERGARRVASINYSLAFYTEAEARDLSARRAEIITMIGLPTRWTQWVKSDGEIGDTYLYSSNRELDESSHSQAWSCYVNWQCNAVNSGVDCRPLVANLRGAVISANFGYRSLHIRADDYSERSAVLLRDQAFRAQDTTGALCAIMQVH